jgi:hypothetical protein
MCRLFVEAILVMETTMIVRRSRLASIDVQLHMFINNYIFSVIGYSRTGKLLHQINL